MTFLKVSFTCDYPPQTGCKVGIDFLRFQKRFSILIGGKKFTEYITLISYKVNDILFRKLDVNFTAHLWCMTVLVLFGVQGTMTSNRLTVLTSLDSFNFQFCAVDYLDPLICQVGSLTLKVSANPGVRSHIVIDSGLNLCIL